MCHNGPNYDYYFIIKELANVFKQKLECFGENTKKYKTFSVPLEKEVKYIDKDDNEGLWQLNYQILLIISQNQFTKLNVKFMIGFLNMKVLKIIL